mgnify:CR=1 FL=1
MIGDGRFSLGVLAGIGRNFNGGFRKSLGGTPAFLDRNKKGVFADGDDIVAG